MADTTQKSDQSLRCEYFKLLGLINNEAICKQDIIDALSTDSVSVDDLKLMVTKHFVQQDHCTPRSKLTPIYNLLQTRFINTNPKIGQYYCVKDKCLDTKDLLIKIFQHLDSQSLIENASKVSRQWLYTALEPASIIIQDSDNIMPDSLPFCQTFELCIPGAITFKSKKGKRRSIVIRKYINKTTVRTQHWARGELRANTFRSVGSDINSARLWKIYFSKLTNLTKLIINIDGINRNLNFNRSEMDDQLVKQQINIVKKSLTPNCGKLREILIDSNNRGEYISKPDCQQICDIFQCLLNSQLKNNTQSNSNNNNNSNNSNNGHTIEKIICRNMSWISTSTAFTIASMKNLTVWGISNTTFSLDFLTHISFDIAKMNNLKIFSLKSICIKMNVSSHEHWNQLRSTFTQITSAMPQLQQFRFENIIIKHDESYQVVNVMRDQFMLQDSMPTVSEVTSVIINFIKNKTIHDWELYIIDSNSFVIKENTNSNNRSRTANLEKMDNKIIRIEKENQIHIAFDCPNTITDINIDTNLNSNSTVTYPTTTVVSSIDHDEHKYDRNVTSSHTKRCNYDKSYICINWDGNKCELVKQLMIHGDCKNRTVVIPIMNPSFFNDLLRCKQFDKIIIQDTIESTSQMSGLQQILKEGQRIIYSQLQHQSIKDINRTNNDHHDQTQLDIDVTIETKSPGLTVYNDLCNQLIDRLFPTMINLYIKHQPMNIKIKYIGFDNQYKTSLSKLITKCKTICQANKLYLQLNSKCDELQQQQQQQQQRIVRHQDNNCKLFEKRHQIFAQLVVQIDHKPQTTAAWYCDTINSQMFDITFTFENVDAHMHDESSLIISQPQNCSLSIINDFQNESNNEKSNTNNTYKSSSGNSKTKPKKSKKQKTKAKQKKQKKKKKKKSKNKNKNENVYTYGFESRRLQMNQHYDNRNNFNGYDSYNTRNFDNGIDQYNHNYDYNINGYQDDVEYDGDYGDYGDYEDYTVDIN